MSTIVDVVVADKNLATMLKGVKAAGIDSELSKKGPFTVFAPTDMAFDKLANGELDELLKPENKIKLTSVLNYHVVPGRINFKGLKDGQKLRSINGKQLVVRVSSGNVTINGAKLQGHDQEASNGVIHTLDSVMPGK